MKKIIKSLFFPNNSKQKILSGPAKGMFVKYNTNHRFQHLLGLYEREIYPYLMKGISKSDLLIDVGANDGYYVMAFLKSGKKVIACEPGYIAEELIANAALNGHFPSENFIVERRLVGSGKTAEYVSIEELTKGCSGSFFLLIDIDGGEYELLNSCGPAFDHNSATWLIETHSKELEDSCIDFLEKQHYKVTIINNGKWRAIVPEQRPLPHNRWLFAEPSKR